MRNFGDNPTAGGFSTDYNGLTNSCVDFTWKALEKGGLNPSGFEGDVWPTNNIDDVERISNNGGGTDGGGSGGGGSGGGGSGGGGSGGGGSGGGGSGGGGSGGGGSGGGGSGGGGSGGGGTGTGGPSGDGSGGSWRWPPNHPGRWDPLVMDLNGDGTKLTPLESSTTRFDFGADGFAELTGWVGPRDGLLVWDRNGNGRIDNGLELSGSAVEDGFAALARQDASGDGRTVRKIRLTRPLIAGYDFNSFRCEKFFVAGLGFVKIATVKLWFSFIHGT